MIQLRLSPIMKKLQTKLWMPRIILGPTMIAAILIPWTAFGQDIPAQLLADLKGPFDLGAERTPQVQYFRMETRFIHIGFDGKRTGIETYVVKLKCVPASLSGKGGDEYVCAGFQLRIAEGPAMTIPALTGWSYVFNLGTGKDEKGQVFGIPHSQFENITDSRGNKLAPAIRYAVYNNFIDFHAFNDVFARPAEDGSGIQDLKNIGQKIVHSSAFSEPPVNLGSGIKEGSFFRNGEVTLEFKGVSIVDGAACAIVGYDSGESTLKMIMPLAADKEMVTTGGSEYRGDLYIGLATRWVRKVTMDESVVTETTMPGPLAKMDAYTVRHLLMRLISKEEFEQK
jgi:hypothetical protein